ncbi:MAG TPA: hypothetical protein VK459_24115 [Polyangiaceae bacterium]|nr:hypothetical protein [Polyangiaceae bacterium]
MRVQLHKAAIVDLEAACDWCEAQREGLGHVLAGEIERALEAIADGLSMWPRWPGSPPEPLIRRCLLPRFPFALGYIAEPDRIVVLAVAHGKREPRYWERSLPTSSKP